MVNVWFPFLPHHLFKNVSRVTNFYFIAAFNFLKVE